MNNNLKIKNDNRIGEVNYSNFGDKMIIIDYQNSSNVIVKFDNGYKTKCKYQQFKNGTIKNPYSKTVYNIGFTGEGIYKTKINGDRTKQYIKWMSMFQRCYDKKLQDKESTYKNCTVCEERHNFQNFAMWFDENYYEIDDETMCLDKDILVKGNKVYSSENCIFVPLPINVLFTKHDKSRGNYPIGVSFVKDKNKYRASCSYNKQIYLGEYETQEEAFIIYKNYKEKIIKNIADLYKDKIPQKLYDALYKYKVEITD
jgi:hypothetical protein